jgi:protein-S-isoprenylcysteine O-methyltransferase Ste14
MSQEAPTSPGVPFPPPLLFVAGFLIALGLDRWVLQWRFGGSIRPTLVTGGWLLMLIGAFILIWAVLTFTRAHTAILPSRPARTIVATGPFRYSRNPMYVALSTMYVGLSLLAGKAWPLVLLPIVLVAVYAIVIRREEHYLASAFGDEYAAYRRRVRRWL